MSVLLSLCTILVLANRNLVLGGRDDPPTVIDLTDQMPIVYLRTPGLPDKNYPPNLFNAFTVKVADGFTLEITFEKFSVQQSEGCAKDFLDIKDRQRTFSLCGEAAGKVIELDGAEISITFVSDTFLEASGYVLRLALKKPPCKCGIANGEIQPRIYGGTELSPENKYPWLVSIGDEKGEHLCGGALISDRFILTAAHCFKDSNGQFNSALNTRVTLGAHNLKKGKKKMIQPFDVILHDEYVNTGYNIRNDIALVRLADPITFNNKIRPICLPSKSMDGPYVNTSVAGWGKTPSAEVSEVPLEVTMPQVDFAKCKELHGDRVKKEKTICFGGIKGRDSCTGDSGGPLITRATDGTHTLIGIVSFGDSCGQVNKYGVYTKVIHYLDWIKENDQEGQTCPRRATKIECGLPTIPTRISGGATTSSTDFPWMAAVGYDQRLIGGGTLVAPNFILTSAFLIDKMKRDPKFDIKKLAIILGTSDLSKTSPTTKSYAVDKILASENSKSLALLRLIRPKEEFEKSFAPICLPDSNPTIDKTSEFIATGWGRVAPNGESSPRLKRLTLTRLELDVCRALYASPKLQLKEVGSPGLTQGNAICASAAFDGLCEGDDGAPLMYRDGQSGRYFLAGLLPRTSPDACLAVFPSVFVDARPALEWITKTISE